MMVEFIIWEQGGSRIVEQWDCKEIITVPRIDDIVYCSGHNNRSYQGYYKVKAVRIQNYYTAIVIVEKATDEQLVGILKPPVEKPHKKKI